MNEICEVSDPELVLKQLKYGNEVDLYLSTSKHKKYMVFDEKGKKVQFGSVFFIRIIQNTKMNKGGIILGIGTKMERC